MHTTTDRWNTARLGAAPWRLVRHGAAALALACAAAACELDATLPAGTLDPASFRNREGALARFHETVVNSRRVFVAQMVVGGLISDELQDNNLGGFGGEPHPIDERILPELLTRPVGSLPDEVYTQLHGVRGSAIDAIGMLRRYAPTSPRAHLGELYALAAYAEIALADQYCSGIPLSTLDFERDFTYQPGSSTAAVYTHAIALLDTALVEAADSAAILDLARVGRGRALLALGRYDDAAAAVAQVATGFSYQFQFASSPPPNVALPPFAQVTVADGEGRNGLPFITSGDPRTAAIDTGSNRFGRPVFVPAKYQGVWPFVLADGIEARLITAEAKLQSGDVAGWLGDLNALRATAITPALADTTDPGTVQGRVDLMFRERAMWLFLTGHRQGDLRRLVRQYGRRQEDVFPTGAYPGGQGVYGSDATIPVPPEERLNPLFTGCINRVP